MTKMPNRCWIGFSLRSLLVGIALLAMGLGWLARERMQSRRELHLAEKFRASDQDFYVELGGRFDPEALYVARYHHLASPKPSWWRRCLNDVCGPRIRHMIVGEDYLRNNDLSEFRKLYCLHDIRLSKSELPDLSPLAGKNLLELRLFGSKVTDLSPLAGITSFRFIRICNTPISDISALSGLKNLEYLFLENTLVQDLSPLSNLKKLELLSLNLTQVSDISPLAELGSLKWCWLKCTQVRDLSPLVGLSNLRVLRLQGTPVSNEEVESLQTALPKCKIEFDPPPNGVPTSEQIEDATFNIR